MVQGDFHMKLNKTNRRTSYRMYLNETPIGISLYAFSVERTVDDMIFFEDEQGFTICCIGIERVERIQMFDAELWRDVNIYESSAVAV